MEELVNAHSDIMIADFQRCFCALAASTKNIFRFNVQNIAIKSRTLIDAWKTRFHIKKIDTGVRYEGEGSTIKSIQHGFIVHILLLKIMEFNKLFFYVIVSGMFLGIDSFFTKTNFLQTLSMDIIMLMILFIIIGNFYLSSFNKLYPRLRVPSVAIFQHNYQIFA